VYGTAEDEQGVVSAMTRQRRGFGGWRGAGELCWWMQDMTSVGRAFFCFRVFPFLSWFYPGSFSFANPKGVKYSSIFIGISATSDPLHPSYCNSIRFRWIPYNVIAALIVSSGVGHQGSFALASERTPEPLARSSTISTSPTSGIQRVKMGVAECLKRSRVHLADNENPSRRQQSVTEPVSQHVMDGTVAYQETTG